MGYGVFRHQKTVIIFGHFRIDNYLSVLSCACAEDKQSERACCFHRSVRENQPSARTENNAFHSDVCYVAFSFYYPCDAVADAKGNGKDMAYTVAG